MVFGSSGQQLPVPGEKSISQYSLLKVSGPKGREVSKKISIYFSYFIHLGRIVIFKCVLYSLKLTKIYCVTELCQSQNSKNDSMSLKLILP